jgi:cytochrome P450
MTRVLREGIASIGSVAVRALSEIPGISGERALRISRMRPGRRRTLAAIEELDAVVTRMVDERAAEPDTEHDDLLGLLLEARDEETGETMSRRQVRDEVMTFMAAGHETTANALAWTWMLLSQHPAARERMLAEIDEALGGRVPTSEDVDRLPWTMAVVSESMRLYPPVWGIGRQAIADDEVGGHRVRRGTVVGIVPYLIHRDPELWPNPEGFDPERFMPGAPERPKLAYMPFGAGRRICVGAGFAQMEAVLLVAMIAQRFTLDLQPAFHAVPEATITLRPRDGMPMTVRRR